MAEYRLSPAAQRDLDAIFDYTVMRWDLSQAMRYTDAIEAACAVLAEALQQAGLCKGIPSPSPELAINMNKLPNFLIHKWVSSC